LVGWFSFGFVWFFSPFTPHLDEASMKVAGISHSWCQSWSCSSQSGFTVSGHYYQTYQEAI